MIDAVAQITKSGFVWVFDRETGRSLFPVKYVDVPPSDVDGEVLARQQPLPTAPPPFARQQLNEDLLTRRTPEARAAVIERFRKLRNGSQFTPPSREGTIVFPGFDGGGEWGGQAFDPETGLFYVNSNEMAWVLRLVPRPARSTETTSRRLYLRHCSGCHRPDLAGTPPEFPSLKGVGERRTSDQIREITRKGAGRMPAFAHLSEAAVAALTRFLATGEDVRVKDEGGLVAPGMKYGIDGYNKFLDPDGYPAIAPPWGTLNAIDLNTGKFAWTIPFGEFPALVEQGIRNTGTENYGGPVVTAGGVLFIGATNHDRKFHAYDSRTGKLLWETTMSAAGNATPVTYEAGGRQFVVIGAGGGKSKISGGSYYAFALPAAAPARR
jgi:quinoprotein glucose dehydrogenase